MYKNKKDVDKHVEKLVSKLSLKDFNARAYSVARLYYEVGDYESCQKYVEQYLTHKANNAAAHKLLGQTLQKIGHKEKALEEFKISLELDPAQTNVVLDICELLADDDVTIDPGRAKYWCEKAELTFPKHPVTFKLRERLLSIADSNPEALIKLLTTELSARPNDVVLHVRLLKHYLTTNNNKEAFVHSCNVEFDKAQFLNNFVWYETLSEVIKCNSDKLNDWLYQLLLLTVKERLCSLSLTEVPHGPSMSLIESNELLHEYDQAIVCVSKSGPMPGYAEFHANLLRHHRAQLTFLAATFLLKKAKKDQLNWYDATQLSSLLMFISWQIVPIDPNANWLTGASDKQKTAVFRWYLEGAYRCSQSVHIILENNQGKSQLFLDKISQFCSGDNWKEKLYDTLFVNKGQKAKADSFLTSNLFQAPALRLPRRAEIQAYDNDAQKLHPNSLHHFVWILMNYKNFPDFKCTIFDMLTPGVTSCGPETLNKLDILAFLYCATLTAQKQKDKHYHVPVDTPSLMPANITDLLCPLAQMKWWDCAYKFSQNELGSEYTDIRSTLSRGIEVVRCMDNHGLDPELLCILGRIFSNLSNLSTIDEKKLLETRASIYYASAIPLLEKLKRNVMIKLPTKRLFDYTHKELDNKELNSLLEESKIFIAQKHYNECEYVKAIEFLTDLRSPESYFYLSASYYNIACDEKLMSKNNDTNSKYVTLLGKAKHYAYKSLEGLKEMESYKLLPLYSNVQDLIENIETSLNKIDSNVSISLLNDGDAKYSSDENGSEIDSVPLRNISQFGRNLSSTPKQTIKQLPKMNSTNYRTALDSQVFNSTHVDQQSLNIIEEQIKNLQKRDATIEDFKEQTRSWFDENKKMGNQIINTIQSNIENTTQQFKLLKISVDEVKDQVAECRKECKDVADLKKQIAELKKEVNKLKKSSSDQTINESDLYNLDEDYRGNENTTFGTQIPFAAPQVVPPFTQRLVPPFPVPPNPYHLYGQNFYNLYNQYSQLTQNTSVPGSSTMFDPNRAQVNYPNIYQTPDQMYLDVAHLVPPSIPPPVVIPTVPNVPVVSIVTTTMVSASSNVPSKTISQTSNTKQTAQALPVNIVITSSDPLPTCTPTSAPILSVTIPQKHIKGSPHNYQIQMPSNTEVPSVALPAFNLSSMNDVTSSNATSAPVTTSVWNKSTSLMFNKDNHFLNANDASKTVVDGPFTSSSPNTTLNKSRTLSERSNTSIENYDPCPDFKPIIPLPAEVQVTTGEESETAIFSARAKLFRFVDKQWKERGIGEMKLLRHNVTGKVRVLMRREQVHKICANHIIVPEMEIKPMKNETKAYFWVANDFAEETVILEKFCIRFKTADIAKEFFDTFEKARLESSIISDKPIESDEVPKTKPDISSTLITSNKVETQSGKTTIGGFTFSTTPSFKIVPEVSKTEKDKVETPTSKVSVFSGLTFKTNTSSTFTNVFSLTPNKNSEISKDNELSSKINTSDTIEEFEPTAEFKPVVPLPALVDQKTGEEDETILFEHRAKLLRFDGQTKEWKERGLGNIKLLVNKENNQKLRLLMRREQIMKVCCNHAITREITFQKMPNMEKAVSWCAKDFSEGELVSETFCLRFKTVQICNDFLDAVKKAQTKLGDTIKAANEQNNVEKQKSQSGFGNQFKPKPGSWCCTACYTNNLESFTKCACCELPNPQQISQSANSQTAKNQNLWGGQFKPKPGTWECKQCLIRNQADSEICSACNSTKDSNGNESETKITKDLTPKFNYNNQKPMSNMPPVTSGWGDTFKLKEGLWECNQCFVRNDKNKEVCSACNSPKDPSSGTSTMTSITNNNPTPKFMFGIPQKPAAAPTTNVSPAPSLFNANASQTFKFGISQNKESTVKMFGDNQTNKSVLNLQKVSHDGDPINFSTKKIDDAKVLKPALLPTPNTSNLTFGSKEGGTFNFAFKPKSPAKGKSPVKSPKSEKGEDSDEYVSDDDGANIHFSPVIPMPDKIDVVTGEENEEELYAHRAKLFIFTDSEWKERGIGIVKILKQKDTGKLRVLMRREQVHKICLNHTLSPDIIYKTKDEKTWIFAANDYSEGDLHLQQFCLRFQNKDVALQFKNEIDKAIERKYGPQDKDSHSDKEKEADDVIFISEEQASTEDKQRAKELMLPENFFTYTNKKQCEGCRGCDTENDEKLEQSTTKEVPTKSETTPSKTLTSYLQNNTNSLYGTPTSLEKTLDSTIFATPSSSNYFAEQTYSGNSNEKSPTKSVSFASAFTQSSAVGSKGFSLAAPKLSTSGDQQASTPKTIFGSTDKKSFFGSSEAKNVFGSMNTKNLFASTETETFGSEKKSIFPNLNINKTTFSSMLQSTNDDSQKMEAKKIVSTDDSQKPVNLFSNISQGSTQKPEVKSIFSTDDSQKPVNLFSNISQGSTQKPEVKSIFSTDDSQKPFNLFSNTSQGSTQKPEVKSIFSTNDSQKPLNLFSNTSQGSSQKPEVKSIFSTDDSQKPVNLFSNTSQGSSQKPEVKSIFSTDDSQKPVNLFSNTSQGSSQKPEVKSIFSTGDSQKPVNLFSGTSQGSIFGPAAQKKSEPEAPIGIFGQTATFKFGFDKDSQAATKLERNENPAPSQPINLTTQNEAPIASDLKPIDKNVNSNKVQETNANAKESLKIPDNCLSFAALSSTTTEFAIQKKSTDFKWEGAGQQLFKAASDCDKSIDNADKSSASVAGDEEYDPHYEPIVPLPEKIVVTTGEEDEEKIYGERCKLYRFDEKSREWKERGVGEMKILYHPERKTYRLLLRREQVHKAVLNMLVFMDLELLPMKNSDRAWTWAGRNYADSAGEQETLAVRFKSVALATNFRDAVLDCVRKLQVAAAEAIRKEKEAEENTFATITPLRLPKHLEDSARADKTISSIPNINQQSSQNDANGRNGEVSQSSDAGGLKQVHFEEQQVEDDQEEDYEHDYDEHGDDYDGYYNEEEEEEESAVFYACDGEVVIEQDGAQSASEEAHVQVLFDNDVCSPKILVTDNNTGEVLADMLIHTDTVFQMSGDSCSWSGVDYTSNTPANKAVTVYFPNNETTMEFYDSCETSKASTYESNDPES